MDIEAKGEYKGIKLFNTMTRTIEKFIPIDGNKVGLYTCGPTVYNFAHIGNLRTYIFEDILKRHLVYRGYDVLHVMNVTDVGHLTSDADSGEDKMELGSSRENKSAWELADLYYKSFMKDMNNLNILMPDIWCKATEHIKEQIEFVKKLEEKGYTYIIDDGVYFDTSLVKDYGKLARLDINGLQAGARVEIAEGKKNITDFALWKFSPKDKQRQMEWDSPWGKGFPGWHIECSAMSCKYLGEQFDIHCGGVDHIAIHHTNEICQTETLTGKPWVNFWMHSEFLVESKEQKMSKSSGDFLTVDTLINKNINPLSYRYLCLNAHYRKQLMFTWEALESANNAFNRLKNKVIEFKSHGIGNINNAVLDEFLKALDNDLNIPMGIGIMWEYINNNDDSLQNKYATLLKMDEVIGFDFANMKNEEISIPDEIYQLVEERNTARQNKDYKSADEIRSLIEQKGYTIEDSKEGVKIKVK